MEKEPERGKEPAVWRKGGEKSKRTRIPKKNEKGKNEGNERTEEKEEAEEGEYDSR